MVNSQSIDLYCTSARPETAPRLKPQAFHQQAADRVGLRAYRRDVCVELLSSLSRRESPHTCCYVLFYHVSAPLFRCNGTVTVVILKVSLVMSADTFGSLV